MELIERVAPRYEVTLVEMGRVYRWRPELAVSECDCGKRSTFKCSDITDGVVCVCECGEDEMVDITEELRLELIGYARLRGGVPIASGVAVGLRNLHLTAELPALMRLLRA